MEKKQVRFLLNTVKTDIEFYRNSGQAYILQRAIDNLTKIKKWQRKEKVKKILKSTGYKLNFLKETSQTW